MNFDDFISNKRENDGLSERLVSEIYESPAEGHNNIDSSSSRTNDPEAQIVVGDVARGEKQPIRYRDAWAGAIFVLQFVTIGFVAMVWGIRALNYKTDTTYGGGENANSFSFRGLFGYCILCGIVALAISVGLLTLLTRNSQHMIEFSVLFSVISDAIIGVYFVFQKNWFGVAVSSTFLVGAILYASAIWRRIPFASANLECALTAARSNGGIAFVALGTAFVVNVVYTGLWVLAWLGIYVRYTAKDCQEQETCFSHTNPIIALFFFFSLLWSWEVGKNVLHVTVAGVVGTWWFAPDEACTFFSPSISDSFSRSTSYSFGSICLGSILTASVQICHRFAKEARRHGRGNEMLLCAIECISLFLERLVLYFNKWAYGKWLQHIELQDSTYFRFVFLIVDVVLKFTSVYTVTTM